MQRGYDIVAKTNNEQRTASGEQHPFFLLSAEHLEEPRSLGLIAAIFYLRKVMISMFVAGGGLFALDWLREGVGELLAVCRFRAFLRVSSELAHIHVDSNI